MSKDNVEKDRKEVLLYVNQLLAEIGLDEAVEDFLQGEYASSVISATYERLEQRLSQHAENAPKAVQERAGDVKGEVLGTEQAFADEVYEEFKIYLARILSDLEDFIQIDEDVLEFFKEALKSDQEERMTKQVMEAAQNAAKKVEKTFFDSCYEGYIPEGIPEGVAKFITAVYGGPLIPITAIFPDFFNEEEEEEGDEEPCDGCCCEGKEGCNCGGHGDCGCEGCDGCCGCQCSDNDD